MSYDLVIRNGIVIDGSGAPRRRADVGILDGRIAAIGHFSSTAREVIDAEGQVVTPGFVDGHTHMDAQVFWDPLGTCSSYHGVTTVVMGNCGFTLAPCRAAEVDFVFRNLERAEDISRAAMKAGIEWTWESFPEYLDVIERLPKGINYSSYVGHSALRTYVMGERAFTERADEADLASMIRLVEEAIQAGAMGLSTSRSAHHETSDGRPVASRAAEWAELEVLVGAMGRVGAGILEFAGGMSGSGNAVDICGRLRRLSVSSGRPITFGMFSSRAAPTAWKPCFDVAELARRDGGQIFIQVHTRPVNILLSFETRLPFDRLELWREIRVLPLEHQATILRDAQMRRRLIEVASRPHAGPRPVGAEAKPVDWDWFFLLDRPMPPHRRVADIAAERGVHPVECLIDLALEKELRQFFYQCDINEDEAQILDMMRHPCSVVTFSDAGAHVSQIMDNSLQTHLLSYWVRERQAFTLEEAVRLITHVTARHWGFHDRGLVRVGMAADLLVFDPDEIAPQMPAVATDLPAGAQRLVQKADGMRAVVVNGRPILRDNRPTGEFPGRLLRQRPAA